MILAVAAGVGALTGVRGFSRAFHTMLQRDARSFMAADLTVRTFQQPDNQADAESWTASRRAASSARKSLKRLPWRRPPATPAPLLISVKAVDPSVYPFYGTVSFNPPQDIRSALQPDTVAVADGVLLRLNAKVGDTVRIGGQALPYQRRSHQRTGPHDRQSQRGAACIDVARRRSIAPAC